MLRSSPPAEKPRCASFDSHPSDLGLVKNYLIPWIDSGLKAGTFIHEADVYAADPADLTREFPPAVSQDGERAWYFFTPLRHKSGRGKRKARTVATGDGWWHNEAKSKPVVDNLGGGRQVGYRQSFSFMKEGAARVRTGWLMMVVRLERDPGHGREAQEEGSMGNLVLCKVYRSPRNPEPCDDKPAAPGLKVEADGDESSAATVAAAPGPKGKSGDDESSDASLAAAVVAASGRKRKSDGEESSAATVASPRRHRKADDEISGAATAAARGPREKAARDEDSAETSAAAPGRKRKAADHDESSGVASAAAPPRKRPAEGSSPTAAETELHLHCPQCGCGFHVDVAESVVAAARAKLEAKSEAGIARVETELHLHCPREIQCSVRSKQVLSPDREQPGHLC